MASSCRQIDLLENAMGIEPQVLSIGIRMDVVITNADEFRVQGRRESRLAFDGAAGHGLKSYWNVTGVDLVRRETLEVLTTTCRLFCREALPGWN